MDDVEIIELYLARDERAIEETNSKYGRLCYKFAYNILGNTEDSRECVNDTYLGVWNLIPPNRPSHLSAYISRIARYCALKKHEHNFAAKRNPETVCSLDELSDCVSGKESVEDEIENQRIETAISDFLMKQSGEKRDIFICRYWYFMTVAEICERTGYGQSKLKSILFNMRKKLRQYLESEGIEI